MKKRIFILISLMFLLTSCTSINKKDYSSIIDEVINSRYTINNEYRTGYKYYAPSGLTSMNSTDYNEVLQSSKYRYYLYVDVVSYYNRVIEEYNEDSNAYFSKVINHDDKFGYIEINLQENKKYLVEIMYNYAKIEVMVEEQDIKYAITNAMIILSSIEYNSDILSSIIGDNVLEFNEETFDIFQAKKKETTYLNVGSSNDNQEETIHDPDLIK